MRQVVEQERDLRHALESQARAHREDLARLQMEKVCFRWATSCLVTSQESTTSPKTADTWGREPGRQGSRERGPSRTVAGPRGGLLVHAGGPGPGARERGGSPPPAEEARPRGGRPGCSLRAGSRRALHPPSELSTGRRPLRGPVGTLHV